MKFLIQALADLVFAVEFRWEKQLRCYLIKTYDLTNFYIEYKKICGRDQDSVFF